MIEETRRANEKLARRLVEKMSQLGFTVATAESCTGGQIAAALTSIAGASAVYRGGVVAYADHIKQRILGVHVETLRQFGAVSEQCALEMVSGARDVFAAEYAIATTGIAGPGGASADKPVGLVYVAFATPRASWVEEIRLLGLRWEIQSSTVSHALVRLLRDLETTEPAAAQDAPPGD